MYSKVTSGGVLGVEGLLIQVETDINDGLPMFHMVGFLSACVKEAGERVRTALKNSGFQIPPKKITINLSPADIRKDGTGYDLAIAVAVLSAYGYISKLIFNDILFIGELSLEGEVRPVNGVLPMVYAALAQGVKYCILSRDNQEEASVGTGDEGYRCHKSQAGCGSVRGRFRQSGVPAIRRSLPGQSKRIQQ